MKLGRRITLLMLVLVFILSAVSIPAMASTFTDISNSRYEQDINLLYDLGVVNGKTAANYDPEGTLTRAEYTAIVLRLLGMEGAPAAENVFNDVPATHWAASSIAVAYNLGLVNGVGNGNFAPDSPVTCYQAAKMLVCALGYGGKAENKGGYPYGYVTVATELGISDRVSLDDNGGITRGEMAALVANSLEIEMYSHPDYDYGVNEGQSFLSYMDIEKYEGQITSNYMTDLDKYILKLEKGKVAIGDKVFDCGNTNAELLLGRKVELYAKKSDLTDTEGIVVSVIPNKYIEELVVAADDIIPSETTKTSLAYYQRGTTNKKSESISSNAVLVYNGVKKDTWDAESLKIARGSITLVTNNGTYPDTVFVDEYKNYLVNAVNAEDETVYLMENTFGKNTLVLKKDSGSVAFSLTDLDGSVLQISDLKKWDVLSVAESADGSILRIIRSNLVVEGKVTQTEDDDIYIDDIDYSVSVDIKKKPVLGDEGIFYLDYYGTVAHFEKGDVSANKLAWLVAMDKKNGISNSLEVKLFTEDSEMLILQTSAKILLDDIRTESMTMFNDKTHDTLFALNAETKEKEIVPQLIKFRLNAAGNVTEIDTAAFYEDDYYNRARLDEFSRDLIVTDGEVDGVSVIYSGGSLRSFGSRFLVRENTKIFSIPPTGKDEDYSIIKNDSLVHNGSYDDVILYDADEDNVLSAVVWMREGAMDTRPTYDMATALVKRTYNKMNSDEEWCYAIECVDNKGKEFDLLVNYDFTARAANALTDINKDEKLWRANERPIELADRVPVSYINPGDIIQYEKVNDEVTCINIMFRGETPGEYDLSWGSYPANGKTNATAGSDLYDRGSAYVGYGTVEGVSKYAARVSVKSQDGKETYERAFVMDAVTPMLYDFDTEQVRLISYEMIYPGDKIVSVRETRYQRFIVVYRNAPVISDAELPPVLPGSVITEPTEGSEKVNITVKDFSDQSGDNTADKAIDGDSATYWQSEKSGDYSEPAHITFDIGAKTKITDIAMEMNQGTTRVYPFWIEVADEDEIFVPVIGEDSEEKALTNQAKDGKVYYHLGELDNVRYIRYYGIGNTAGSKGLGYVQLKEFELYGIQPEVPTPNPDPDPTPDPDPEPTVTPGPVDTISTGSGLIPATVHSFTAEANPSSALYENGNATNAVDGDASTVWGASCGKTVITPNSIVLDLGSVKTVTEVGLYLFKADRGNPFSLEISEDGTNFEYVIGTSELTDTCYGGSEKLYHIGKDKTARYIRFTSTGNRTTSAGAGWIQLLEMTVYGK